MEKCFQCADARCLKCDVGVQFKVFVDSEVLLVCKSL